jgi:hypothetical protein
MTLMTARTSSQQKRKRRWITRAAGIWLVLVFVSVLASCIRIAANDAGKPRAFRGSGGTDLRTSAGLAPVANQHAAPVVQVYAARTWGLKKAISVHTWIATKRQGARSYTTYQVIGWRMRGGRSALVVESGSPDQPWYGNTPQLLVDLRGAQYASLIDEIENAVANYPYRHDYTIWPGPNSNTFTAFIARQVPGLELDLPSTAIGKDYLGEHTWIDVSSGGDGWQISAAGIAGIAISPVVGLELNLLGLNLELDLDRPAIELPGFGRVGSSYVGLAGIAN